MSVQRFTTEFEEVSLSICVIDCVGLFSSYISEYITEKQISVTNITPAEFFTSESQNKITSAYKIVVCLSPTQNFEDVRPLLESLSDVQHKVRLVLPLISGSELEISGELPFFSEYQESQRLYIVACNDVLPQTLFIFGQDIIFPPNKFGLFDLCCQNIQSGFVFCPSIICTPHSLPNFCRAAVDELFQPHAGSVCIMGKTKSASTILGRVASLYERYYFSDIATQAVGAHEEQTIPFAVKNTVLSEDEETLTAWYARQLPSPDQRSFFLPSFYKPAPIPLTIHEPVDTALNINTFGNDVDRSSPVDQPKSPFFEDEKIHTTQENSGVEESEITETAPELLEKITISQSVTQTPTVTKEEFNVNSEIQRIFVTSHQEKTFERAENLVKVKTKLQKKSRKRRTLFYGGLLFTGLGLVVLVLMAVYLATFYFFKQALISVLEKNTANQEITTKDLNRLKRNEVILSAQSKLYQHVINLPQLEEGSHAVLVSQRIKEIIESTNQTQLAAKKMLLTILGKDAANLGELAENIGTQSLKTYENLASIESDLSQISFAQTEAIEAAVLAYQKQVSTMKKQVAIQQQLQNLLAPIFGVDGKRTYAIIFQNNQELRPTGGFIEAVALLTFDKGTLINKEVYTSYELHKKMPGEVIAPPEIYAATGEKVFFFHDSNWNPDFPKSAEQMSWFIEKSLQKEVSGVITVDLYALQNMLEVLGPLDLPEFNEVITHKNLFERMEFHSEVILVESEKNQDYRKLLFSRILEKIAAMPDDKFVAFVEALKKSFIDQSMLVYFKKNEEEQTMQAVGWSGAQRAPRCPQELATSYCLVDQFMQVEANLGVNKANYYLTRTVDHTITLSPTQVNHRRVVSYENIAQLNAWPKGVYKNYLRFYVPVNAQSVEVLLDDVPLPASQLKYTEENGQKVVGFMVEVPIKTKRNIVLQYTVPLNPEKNEKFSYVFYNQEQPGNGETPAVIRFLPDPALHPTLITPEATVAPDGIIFTTNDLTTSIYGVQFDQAK